MATAKKLLLEGESIAFRFFDSRLYEKQLAKGQELPTAQLLSFKGERGRNPSRVIKELLTLTRLRGNETPPILHLFTHAAFYAPRNLIEQLTQQCQVAAVFMLPSGGELNLNYIDLLKMHWVVDHETLGQGKRRAEAARDILADVHADLDAPGSQRSGAMEVL